MDKVQSLIDILKAKSGDKWITSDGAHILLNGKGQAKTGPKDEFDKKTPPHKVNHSDKEAAVGQLLGKVKDKDYSKFSKEYDKALASAKSHHVDEHNSKDFYRSHTEDMKTNTQDLKNRKGDNARGKDLADPSIAVHIDGKNYVLDGQHRMNTKLKSGQKAPVVVMDGSFLKKYGIGADHFDGKTHNGSGESKKSIEKGGPGSGVQGHVTMHPDGDKIQHLTRKLETMSPFQSRLHELKNGAVMDQHETKSGKPLFLDVDQAIAHGYTPEDFKDAGNVHYEMAQKISQQLDKLRELKKEPPKEAIQIAKFHMQKFKQCFAAGDRLENRMKNTNQAVEAKRDSLKEQAKKMKKSVTSMMHLDGLEIDTAKFAIESQASHNCECAQKIGDLMHDQSYGDIPREFMLPAGSLFMSKVDDGVYSGFFVKHQDGMEDNAKVRIERMTIPTLVQFLHAKEWIKHQPEEPVAPVVVPEVMEAAPIESLMARLVEEPKQEEPMDKRIRILELLSKLMS